MYKEAANKFLYVLRNSEQPLEPARAKNITELAKAALDSGLWVKTQIDDKKQKQKGTSQAKSKGDMTLGLSLLGANYNEAF